jgi:hypothetical protein
MKFRLAKKSDINCLARIQFDAGKTQPGGFIYKLGLTFLKSYYSLLLSEKNSVVLLAENDEGTVCGFCAGTLSAEEHIEKMNNSRIRLAFSLIPAIIKNPNLIYEVLSRNKFVKSRGESSNISISTGPRFEYWVWHTKNKDPIIAITLLKLWLKVLFTLGVPSVKAEVDIINVDILRLHKRLGAKVIRETTLFDGRKRVHIEYLNKR